MTTIPSITTNLSFLRKTDAEIEKEFLMEVTEPSSEKFSDALAPENAHKNRSLAVLPFNENRVKLSLGDRTDYINASLCLSGRVILCQWPLPNAHFDFYSMLDQYNVTDILSVNNWKENITRQLYIQYAHTVLKTCGPYDIRAYAEIENSPLRKLGIYMTRLFIEKIGQEKQVVSHYRFPEWSDDTEDCGKSVAALARIVLDSMAKKKNGRVVIHSAGVSRAGTVATVISAYQRIQDCIASGKTLPGNLIQETVTDLRLERSGCVGDLSQYKTIYAALKELYHEPDLSKEVSI